MESPVLGRVIKEILNVSHRKAFFTWHGGEPTLLGLPFWEEVVQTQEAIQRDGQSVVNIIQTNGTLIDEQVAGFLAKHRFSVGISLDGPREFHDTYRKFETGEGTFGQVLRAISRLRNSGVEPFIITVINNLNVHDPGAMFHFLTSNRIVSVSFSPCLITDGERRPLYPGSVKDDEYAAFLCEFLRLWLKTPRSLRVRQFQQVIRVINRGTATLCHMSHGCGRQVTINPLGNVYFGCEDHLGCLLGSVLEFSLKDMLNSTDYRKYENELVLTPRAECLECSLFHGRFCSGGCPKRTVSLHNEKHYYFCKSNQALVKEVLAALPRLKEIGLVV